MTMDKLKQKFDIIEFTADSRRYFPASMEKKSWMNEYVKHTEIEIQLGQSRYGGPIVDLPEGVTYPDGLFFAAQIDLAKFSPFDKSGLLPKSGQLILFADIRTDKGKVIYADIPNDKLTRVTKEHTQNFWDGVLIDKIFASEETLEERFEEDEGKNIWSYFAGCRKSKIFGIFTDCQLSQKEIEDITFSDKVLLLQVGENGFNDEGVFSVLIPRKDLETRNFDNCEFSWGQS